MKRSTRYRLTAIGLGLFSAAIIVAACSNSTTTPTGPTEFDSGSTPDSGAPTQDSSSSSGDSSTPPPQDSSAPVDAFIVDSNLPDVGPCVSDAAPTFGDAQVCSSCYTPAQDPLNGCSPYTVNCVPYDNSQLPPGAP